MQRTIALLISCCLLAAGAEPGLDPSRLALLKPRMQELVDQHVIAGGVALVARHGHTALLEAAGKSNIEDDVPMRTDSIFQVMSMTKNFTGVAAMMLVEEGKLELRRKVEDYLPEFAGIKVEELGRDLHTPEHAPTVWQLMCHTSGLGGDPGGELKDNPRTLRVPLAEAVAAYGKEHLSFEPGTRWRYSNMGIAALGRIVEVVSGEDYVHFVTAHILQPLGMKDSFFFPPKDKLARISLVYKRGGQGLVRSGDEILAGDSAKYRAGAKYPAPEFGLYSTAPDLVRFYQMLLNGGEYEGRRYLSRQSIETMTRTFTPDVKPSGWLGGTTYGLTFELVTENVGTLLLHSPGTFGHGGAFGTEGWIDPKNDLIRIALTQISDGSSGPFRAAVMQIGEAAVLDSARSGTH